MPQTHPSDAVFTIECLLRNLVAGNRWRYVFSFYGLIDLLAIAPFYLSFGVDLRAAGRLGRALATIREELLVFFTATVIVL